MARPAEELVHDRVIDCRGREVQAKSCNHCLSWTTEANVLQEVLSNKGGFCEGCAHRADMKVVTEQYQMRRPRWWMVGSTVVVPIWMVEMLKARRA